MQITITLQQNIHPSIYTVFGRLVYYLYLYKICNMCIGLNIYPYDRGYSGYRRKMKNGCIYILNGRDICTIYIGKPKYIPRY